MSSTKLNIKSFRSAAGRRSHQFSSLMVLILIAIASYACETKQAHLPSDSSDTESPELTGNNGWQPATSVHVIPPQPIAGKPFKLVSVGASSMSKALLTISGGSNTIKTHEKAQGDGMPFWRVDDVAGLEAGNYTVVIKSPGNFKLDFQVLESQASHAAGKYWKTQRGWDSGLEALYAAWIQALFRGSQESDSWDALHRLTQNKDRNFLYDALGMNEDDSTANPTVVMEPDCADNPYFLRAYFAWKMGLPFGFHLADRGYLGKHPQTGQWITNEHATNKSNPIHAFNILMRRVMDGVHSGTARASLDNPRTDTYPVALSYEGLRPGTVFADPYGHTFVLIGWKPQRKKEAGQLLAVDAQPDGTVAVKRFWKGNFLFNTHEVVGEPGFKAFRPILNTADGLKLLDNAHLISEDRFAPFSLEQRNMDQEHFYGRMDSLINPRPMDAFAQLNNLIVALHEQLLVRVRSVANAEAYLQNHPGSRIPMPSNANAVFQTGGLWEDFSTPNRDLRLLIAMDEVLNFPDKVAAAPARYNMTETADSFEIKELLLEKLQQQCLDLHVTYVRSDGQDQQLSVWELLQRRTAFEMAYNPNDCIETRWGAPEGSAEKASCKRKSPDNQYATMSKVRKWFEQRLHPPT